MSTKHEVPFIVTVVNDAPIKNHLKKWFSIPHITRRKISLKAILYKLTSNINLRMLSACFSVDSILQKLECVSLSKKFLSSDLGLPTDFFFYSLGGNCIFSHFKRSAIFICPIYVAIRLQNRLGRRLVWILTPQESVNKIRLYFVEQLRFGRWIQVDFCSWYW